MTACSNHPATMAGAALQELLAAQERLHQQLGTLETRCCAAAGIAWSDWRMLVAIDRKSAAGEVVSQHGSALLRDGYLVTQAGRLTMTAAGRDILARVDRIRYAALDDWARATDTAALRNASATLAHLAGFAPAVDSSGG